MTREAPRTTRERSIPPCQLSRPLRRLSILNDRTLVRLATLRRHDFLIFFISISPPGATHERVSAPRSQNSNTKTTHAPRQALPTETIVRLHRSLSLPRASSHACARSPCARPDPRPRRTRTHEHVKTHTPSLDVPPDPKPNAWPGRHVLRRAVMVPSPLVPRTPVLTGTSCAGLVLAWLPLSTLRPSPAHGCAFTSRSEGAGWHGGEGEGRAG